MNATATGTAIATIGEICELVNGRAFKPTEWTDSGLPIIRIQNLNDETKEFNYFDGDYNKKHEVNDGDLLFSWSGTPGTSFGAFFWNRGRGVLNQHIFNVLIDDKRVEKRYFRYAINSRLNEIISHAHGGVGLQHITKGKLESIQIPLPPLSEQKRIADILDKADAIRRKRQIAASHVEGLCTSLFLQMFASRVGNLSGKAIEAPETEKGRKLIAAGWKQTTIGEQIVLQRGVDITKNDHLDGLVPVISSGGINGYHDTAIAAGPGVLLGRKGSVGSVHYIDGPYWPHDTTLWVRDFRQNEPRFVYEFFRQFPIRTYEASSANPSLNRNNLHPVRVWWPPIDLQKRFSSVAEQVQRSFGPKANLAERTAEEVFCSIANRVFCDHM